MFKLFTLIFSFLLLGFNSVAIGADGTISLSFVSTNQTGTVDIFRIDSQEKAKSSLLRLDLQAPTLKKYWTLGGSLDIAKKDYSNFLIRNQQGEEIPLSDTFEQEEYTGSVSISYQKGKDSVSGLIAGSLSDSPFSFNAAALSYDRIFLNKKRIIGARVIASSKEQPGSTYIDPSTLETKDRPTKLNFNRYELNWNEAFSQNWRLRTTTFYGTRRADRPDHYGLELRNGVGVLDSLTFRVHTGFLNERRTELKDDRGYLGSFWAETSLYWEFQYDYSLEAAYGFMMERESFEDSRGSASIGTDSYGLKFNYKGVNWNFFSSYVLRRTNTGYQSHTVQGGITWLM